MICRLILAGQFCCPRSIENGPMSEPNPTNGAAQNKTQWPIVSIISLIVSMLALAASIYSLVLQNPKVLHPLQAPVGLRHTPVNLLTADKDFKGFRCDLLTLVNEDTAPLTNVVLTVKSPGGLAAKYSVGDIGAGKYRRICLTYTRALQQGYLPRDPFELGLDDVVVISCDKYLEREFSAKELGKTEHLKPSFVMPYFSRIDRAEGKKYDGQEIWCFAYADFIDRDGENMSVRDRSDSGQLGISRIVALPRGRSVEPNDLLFVKGVLHCRDIPQGPKDDLFRDFEGIKLDSFELKIAATEVVSLGGPYDE
jgi:hypothetical protein